MMVFINPDLALLTLTCMKYHQIFEEIRKMPSMKTQSHIVCVGVQVAGCRLRVCVKPILTRESLPGGAEGAQLPTWLAGCLATWATWTREHQETIIWVDLSLQLLVTRFGHVPILRHFTPNDQQREMKRQLTSIQIWTLLGSGYHHSLWLAMESNASVAVGQSLGCVKYGNLVWRCLKGG